MRTSEALVLVARERGRQDAVHGENRDFPDGTGGGVALLDLETARDEYERAVRHNRLTWWHILDEEVQEVRVETDREKLKRELVQVAAVALAWVEALDRRAETGAP